MIKDSKKLKVIGHSIPFQIDYTANYNKSFRREFQALYISKDITPDEFAILYSIHLQPDITQSEMAKLLFKGKAHIGKILNDMETRGLIKRVADTKDNIIIKRNEITPKGQIYFDKGHKEYERFKAAIIKEFPAEDREQFLSYLEKYRKILDSFVNVELK